MSAVTLRLADKVRNTTFRAERLLQNYLRAATTTGNTKSLGWTATTRYLFEDVLHSAISMGFFKKFFYRENYFDTSFIDHIVETFSAKIEHGVKSETESCVFGVAKCLIAHLAGTSGIQKLTLRIRAVHGTGDFYISSVIAYILTTQHKTLTELNIIGKQADRLWFHNTDLFALISTMPQLVHLSLASVPLAKSKDPSDLELAVKSCIRLRSLECMLNGHASDKKRVQPLLLPPNVQFLRIQVYPNERSAKASFLDHRLKGIRMQTFLTIDTKLRRFKKPHLVKLLPILSQHAMIIALKITEEERHGEETQPEPVIVIAKATDHKRLTDAINYAYNQYVAFKKKELALSDDSDEANDY